MLLAPAERFCSTPKSHYEDYLGSSVVLARNFEKLDPAKTLCQTSIADPNRLMMAPVTNNADSLRIEVVESVDDIVSGFDSICRAFGDQTQDAIWMVANPGWETPEGRQLCASRLAARLTTATRDRQGRPNTIFLKATINEGEDETSRKIVGMAIWLQASVVEGCGDKPAEDPSTAMNLEDLYPGDKATQQFFCDLSRSLHARRVQVVKEKALSSVPSAMVLDLCAVDPSFQGKGIAKQLVQWGLDEAKSRGNLECILEASTMGRRVYLKMGFEQEGPEIEYDVAEQFAGVKLPSNVFLRTQKGV